MTLIPVLTGIALGCAVIVAAGFREKERRHDIHSDQGGCECPPCREADVFITVLRACRAPGRTDAEKRADRQRAMWNTILADLQTRKAATA